MSLGHAFLEVPSGCAPWAAGDLLPQGGLASAVRDSAWLARCSGELVPSKASVSVFLAQQTLPREARLVAEHWGSTRRPHLYPSPLSSAWKLVITTY